MADAEPYNHNLPIEAYRAALQYELTTVPLERERKAAIVDELEALGNRTAVENRAGVESAGGIRAGVAPGTGPVDADQTVGRHADTPSADGH